MNPFSNPEIETTLLACFLEYPDTYHQAIAMGMTADCFSLEHNRVLFWQIAQLGEAGHPIAYESVLSGLDKHPAREKLVAALEDLTNPLHVPKKDVQWHVERLKNIARRCQMVAVCKRAITTAHDGSETTAACLDYLQQGLIEIQSQSSSSKPTLVKDFIGHVIREIESRSVQTELIGVPTGLSDLDEATTGIRPGELWVIGATPGCGKTALGTQIALASAKTNRPAVIFSLEMTQEELGARLLANESPVSSSCIRNPKFITADQWRAVGACMGELCKLPLYVDATPSLSIHELVARARRFVRQHHCQLVVVDYIRLIKASGQELREQVGNATDALRQLAKTEKVGVIALSQLSRPNSKSLNAKPSMMRLKESGDIEAHAHVVLLIHMPTKSGKPTGEDVIIIAKNRHGPIGTIEVTFNRDRLKFLPRTEEGGPNINSSLFPECQ